VNEIPNTERRSATQLPAVAVRFNAPEGPGTGGNKPLMRNRKAPMSAPATGITAGNNFARTSLTLRVLRRQLTCLRKQNQRLSREAKAARAATHVVRWARRFVNNGTVWNEIQLKRAITRLDNQ
jgi:hypothetical protein